jgi:AcrR family transcriptional regulator
MDKHLLMTKDIRTRATTDEGRKVRADSLLSAARELFETRDFVDISTADIAQRAGLAKGTLFLYFKTKEALFLEVLSISMRDWFVESATLIKKRKKSPQTLANVIATTLLARPALIRLLASLHPVLDRNNDPNSILKFKESLLQLTNDTASLFHEALGLPMQRCARIALWMHSLIVGLAQVTSPSRLVRSTLENPHLAHIQRDFATEVEDSLRALFDGVNKRPSR